MIPVAAVLEWKLGQTYFDAKCGTREVKGAMVVDRWDATAAGRAQPSASEIEAWTTEWETAGRPSPAAPRDLHAEIDNLTDELGALKDRVAALEGIRPIP